MNRVMRDPAYFVDQRNAARVRIERHFVLLHAESAHTPEARKAPTVDLSHTGIGFLADRSYEPGSEVRLAIQIPFRQAHVRVRGRIVHCVPTDGGRFRVGAAYARLSAGNDEALFDTLLGLLL